MKPRFLVQFVAAASLALALNAAFAEDALKPDSTTDMAKALEPGPLPELSLGDAKGLPVIEYGSLTCSHCAEFERDVLPQFKAKYVDTGKVRYIYREYSRNSLDVAAYMLARCVGDDKAFATIELLFAQQDKWAFVQKPLEALILALRPTGMGKDRAMECLKDQAKADAFKKITEDATKTYKITGTPTFIIDGKVYGGGKTAEQLDAILAPLVK